jgi:predicted RNA-binding Zn-ribbon protein involved in translation (DUF1610 family)
MDETQKSADQKFCFSCGTVLHTSADRCPKCGAIQPTNAVQAVYATPGGGAALAAQQAPQASGAPQPLAPGQIYCRGCGSPVHESARSCPKCGAVLKNSLASAVQGGGRNRIVAIVLALFLGGFGLHRFYTGRIASGVLYLLFAWTFIPAIIAFVEAIFFLMMSDEEFQRKYPA